MSDATETGRTVREAPADSQSRFESKVVFAFAAAALAVLLLAAATWKLSQDAAGAARWVSHTQDVLVHVARARGQLHLVELSTQDYRLTGDSARLAERDAAVAAGEAALRQIKELTADHPGQQARWGQVRAAADEGIAISRRTEVLRKTQGPESAATYAANARPQAKRNGLTDLLDGMRAEELRLLEERNLRASRAREALGATAALATLALLALLLSTYVLIRRQTRATEASRRALADSEQSLAATLRSIGDAVLESDTEGRVTRMNPVAERLTGWPLAEALGRPVEEVFRIVNEQTRAPAVVPVAQVLATGMVQGLANHTVLIARNGTEWPIADSAAPIRGAGGRLRGVVLVFHDVTAERQLVRAMHEQNAVLEQRVQDQTAQLRASEAELRSLIDGVPVLIASVDAEQRYVYVNSRMQELFAPGQAPVAGRTVRDVLGEARYAIAAPHIATVLQGEVSGFEWQPFPDLWQVVAYVPRLDGAGRVAGYYVVIVDISERKRAELALHRSEERLRLLVDGVRDYALIMLDPAGRIVTWNAGARRLHGYAEGEIVGKSMNLFYPPDEIAAGKPARMLAVAAATGRCEDEGWRVRQDGTGFVANTVLTALRDGAGQLMGYAKITRDLTEPKAAEQAIRDLNVSLELRVTERTAQLEQANRVKTDFLASMSHELRTPLNAIIGFSEILRDGVLGELEARQREAVHDISEAGAHLLALINDILDLSKVEAGAMQVDTRPVDLPTLLEASTLVVRERAAKQRLRLSVRLDPSLHSMMADERKLKQVVYNLLSNAVEFTSDGGAVVLAARRCRRADVALAGALPGRLIALPPGENAEFVEITVADTGSGIAAEDLPRLFEPFMQVESSVARSHPGTGLGLSLVRRLAALHGGTVGVTSRLHAGSCFYVWLPYREATRVIPVATPAPVRAAGPESSMPLALVIEDDDRMAELIATQLRAEGYRVMLSATAEEGLVHAARSRPQLITVDIFLPGMDGWELLRRVKADPTLADTPVVIITIADDLGHGLALGARRVLQKPFSPAELVATLAGLFVGQPREGARVLVVDDNVKAVDLVATALEKAGYGVLRAYGGAEAITVAQSQFPDVVILDLMMPEVSGFEVASALRESASTAGIPIVVLTAKDLSAEERATLDLNVVALLAKASLKISDLLTELRRALGKPGTERE